MTRTPEEDKALELYWRQIHIHQTLFDKLFDELYPNYKKITNWRKEMEQ